MLAFSLQALERNIKAAQQQQKKLVKDVKQAALSGSIFQIRRKQNSYFRSDAVKLHAAYRAVKRLNTSRRSTIFDVAREIDLFEPSLETLGFNTKRRPDGRQRQLIEFGPVNVARQLMVLDILKATSPIPDWQYCASGRGVNLALEHIIDAITQGFTNYAVADIADCYPSFDTGKIIKNKMLPLPEKIVRHTVMAEGLAMQRYRGVLLTNNISHDEYPRPRCLGGLPQGSVCSPYVAGLLLKDVQNAVISNAKIFAYADDFLILTRGKSEASETLDRLRDALRVHRSGHLRLRHEYSGELQKEPVEFLGYEIGMVGRRVSIRLSKRNDDKLTLRLLSAVDNDLSAEDLEIPQVRAVLADTIRSFRHLTKIENFYSEKLRFVDHLFWKSMPDLPGQGST